MRHPGPLPPGQRRDALLAAVDAELSDVPQDATVVVAISGGPDSTALAYLTAEARPDLALVLVHVRHGLRDDDAADRAVVARHADYLGADLEVVEVAVVPDGHGVEAAARDARYAALREVAARRGARWLLLGHSANDQAETVLLRATRGTGTRGLAAMRPRTGDLVRPLLRLRREDLRRFVTMEGLPVATDPTNEDVRLRRVAVRTGLLPALAEVAPDPVGALGRLADLAAEDEAALDGLAEAALARSAARCGDVVAIRDEDLAELPVAVRRRLWRRVLASCAPGPPPPSATIAALLELGPGRRLEVGDLEVTAGGGWRAVAPRRVRRSAPGTVAVPGATVWSPAAIEVRAITPETSTEGGGGQIAFALSGTWTPPEPPHRTLAPPPGGHAERCVLVLPAGLGPLELRHRRPGDRCRTAGGTRTVADVLVDERVPRPVRDRWPVLVADGRVLWVPGVAADADVLAAGRDAPAVQLVVSPSTPG